MSVFDAVFESDLEEIFLLFEHEMLTFLKVFFGTMKVTLSGDRARLTHTTVRYRCIHALGKHSVYQEVIQKVE